MKGRLHVVLITNDHSTLLVIITPGNQNNIASIGHHNLLETIERNAWCFFSLHGIRRSRQRNIYKNFLLKMQRNARCFMLNSRNVHGIPNNHSRDCIFMRMYVFISTYNIQYNTYIDQ